MYAISYSRGDEPVLMQSKGAESQLRRMCEKLASQYDYVTLLALDGKGFMTPVAQWLSANGANVGDMTEESQVSETADDEESTYEGFCVKCRDHRAFVGEVVEMANGRRRAAGNCPVCGTGISRILSNLPVSDDYHTPDDEEETGISQDETAERPESVNTGTAQDEAQAEAVEQYIREQHSLNRASSNRGTHLTCSCGEWEKWVTRKTEKGGRAEFEKHVEEMVDAGETVDVSVDAAPGTPIEEIAAQVAEVAEELAEPVKAQRTRKTKAKATTSRVTDAEIQSAKDMKVKVCPQCQKKVPIMERAGIEIFTVHPNAEKNLDRCPGSTTAA